MLTLRSKKLCIITLLFTYIFHSAYSHTDDYCENTIDMYKYSEKLHFVGEIGDLDFGLVNMTKTLHCCAYGFTKIEWLKNNKPYPWSPNTSSFIVDESSHGQTLFSRRAMMSDSGVYTCIARNGSDTVMKDIKLEILAPESALTPRMTYATKDQSGNIGDFARLYCEGFVGKSKKSNFSGVITWEKGLSERYLDRAFIDGYRVIQINSHRDENQILSSYLIFMNVEPDDLNMYTCRITNGNHRAVEQRAWILDSRDPEELARILFISIFAILPMFAIASVLVFLAGFALPIEKITDWLRRLEDRYYGLQEKEKSILVIYHAKDKSLMSKTILPKFLDLYPFKMSLYPIYSCEEDFMILLKKAKTYDGVIVIMTLNLAGNEWSCDRINLSIRVINKLHKAFICVFTRRLPPFKGESGQRLRATLRKTNIHIIRRKYLRGKTIKAYLNRINKITKKLCKPCGNKKKQIV